eukprot:CAMPEP_0182867966 /NCGR_PEP_ID=MMETSP0034_2-20130328/9034_1 /TAXON_ID=156128 /ORGANISM="Nephroselmis pyriformis, Strain CCMP717" /LENGTH=335 /DNA_ID=CAMNT_0025000353 /DNA_START=40 /DNA_END=1047 /DNA_ORIENTATION=-
MALAAGATRGAPARLSARNGAVRTMRGSGRVSGPVAPRLAPCRPSRGREGRSMHVCRASNPARSGSPERRRGNGAERERMEPPKAQAIGFEEFMDAEFVSEEEVRVARREEMAAKARRYNRKLREEFSDCIDSDECITDFDFAEVANTKRSVVEETWERGRWLFGLLVLQSTSSVVLEKYEGLIQDHLVVTLFLTMLVGAGGNAGNQSAISVIRGLATGDLELSVDSFKEVMGHQLQVALLLGTVLTLGGFLRVYISNGEMVNALAISAALFCIVVTSVLAGTVLPFALAATGTDPANAGTSIQVVMDILGVTITCAICSVVLDGAIPVFMPLLN